MRLSVSVHVLGRNVRNSRHWNGFFVSFFHNKIIVWAANWRINNLPWINPTPFRSHKILKIKEKWNQHLTVNWPDNPVILSMCNRCSLSLFVGGSVGHVMNSKCRRRWLGMSVALFIIPFRYILLWSSRMELLLFHFWFITPPLGLWREIKYEFRHFFYRNPFEQCNSSFN